MPSMRRAGQVMGGLAVLYLLVLGGFAVAQTDLIFPGPHLHRGEDARFELRPGTSLVPLGEGVVALFGPATLPGGEADPEAARRPTLLFFYGNGGSVRRELRRVERFRRLGANVLVPDYPGYGVSDGSPSEASCERAAMLAFDHLQRRPDVDGRRVVSMGESLGGAIAIDLATRRPVAGLVTTSTFTSMGAMARREYPWLFVGPILRHPFDSVTKISRVRCPVLLAHGTADRFIPLSMRDELAAATQTPVTRVDIVGGGHGNAFEADGARLLHALDGFLDALPQPQA